MAGQIHSLIKAIIDKRAKGNPALVATTRTKLILKGINPDSFGPASADDPATLQKVKTLAAEFGIAA